MNRRSLIVLTILGVTYAAIISWRPDLLDPEPEMDWLLGAIWLGLTLACIYRVEWRNFTKLLVAGFLGGALIEWWGTTNQIWDYYTHEKPPLWIIPCWPVSALAFDRMLAFFDPGEARMRKIEKLYWLCVPGYALYMTGFAWPFRHAISTWGMFAILYSVAFLKPRPAHDLGVFLIGSLYGWVMEYWGTSNYIWTYYTYETPPAAAAMAHGFAAVFFARVVRVFEWLVIYLKSKQKQIN
ncbi:MAG: hypothetical protein AB7F66_06040 [Bacteriovoracia bacterium]